MKKYILKSFIVLVIVFIVCNYKKIYREYSLRMIKKECLNELNGIFSEYTDEYIKKAYERYHKPIDDMNHYNVTELIETYVRMVEESLMLYINTRDKDFNANLDIKKRNKNINDPNNLEYGKDIWMQCENIVYDIFLELEEEDFVNYNNGDFFKILISKLKKILDYNEINNKTEWKINIPYDCIIELPYNCYIDYKAYHRLNNKEYKKALDIIFDKNFELKKNIGKVIVKYETTTGEIKETQSIIYYSEYNGKDYYSIDIKNGLFIYGADNIASAIISSHTRDNRIEEVDKEYFNNYSKFIE